MLGNLNERTFRGSNDWKVVRDRLGYGLGYFARPLWPWLANVGDEDSNPGLAIRIHSTWPHCWLILVLKVLNISWSSICAFANSSSFIIFRIVLNKADGVDHQQLMRVYGALMWSLGKVLATPEVSRVYIGSFWNEPLRFDMNRKLFEAEEQDLFADLQSLPRNAALRKLNDLIKRARLVPIADLMLTSLTSASVMNSQALSAWLWWTFKW